MPLATTKTSYPSRADLSAFLAAARLAIPSDLDVETAIGDAVSEWEAATGWMPFLAELGDATQTFDPPGDAAPYWDGCRGGGRKLYFSGGLVSFTSLTVDGRIQARGIDFFLRPSDAPLKNRPWTYAEFVLPVYGPPESVALTGRRGYWTSVPTNAWNAILARAARLCAPQIAIGITGGLASWKEGDEERRFAVGKDSGPLVNEIAAWKEQFRRAASFYERKQVF